MKHRIAKIENKRANWQGRIKEASLEHRPPGDVQDRVPFGASSSAQRSVELSEQDSGIMLDPPFQGRGKVFRASPRGLRSFRLLPHWGIMIILAVVLVFEAGTLHAQTIIDWSDFNGGGGAAASGSILINGSLGGFAVGTSVAGASQSTSGFWTGVPTTLFSALPFLNVELSDGSKVQLSWPVTAEGFTLERATTLTPPNWMLLRTDINVDQGMNIVHEEAASMHFYRLKKEMSRTRKTGATR